MGVLRRRDARCQSERHPDYDAESCQDGVQKEGKVKLLPAKMSDSPIHRRRKRNAASRCISGRRANAAVTISPPSGGLNVNQACLVYQSALIGVKLAHFSGKSSRAKIAVTGQTGTQAPQSMHSTGLM
jgi:hypothetical protein